MSYYKLLKPFVHALPPEAAHELGVKVVGCGALPAQPVVNDERLEVNLAGLKLPNPVGLAAGFDKNAQTLPHIFKQGFGFAECGTVTPKAQAGNPKPRMFRLPEHEAVVNALGFNNGGLAPYVERLKQHQGCGIVGANIGKNKTSKDAVADYVECAQAVYAYADYITINISSPNTEGLRDLQEADALGGLIKAVHSVRDEQKAVGQPHKSIFVKIAPDLDAAQIEAIAGLAVDMSLDALIVSNTTISRPGMDDLPDHLCAGGLSGKPLMSLATQTLREIAKQSNGKVPLIGVGGIASAEDAYSKFKAGASAVQLYSALVYQGFDLVTKINRGLIELMDKDGIKSLKELT